MLFGRALRASEHTARSKGLYSRRLILLLTASALFSLFILHLGKRASVGQTVALASTQQDAQVPQQQFPPQQQQQQQHQSHLPPQQPKLPSSIQKPAPHLLPGFAAKCPSLGVRPPIEPRADAYCNTLGVRDGEQGIAACRERAARQHALQWCEDMKRNDTDPSVETAQTASSVFKLITIQLPEPPADQPRLVHSSFVMAVAHSGDVVSNILVTKGSWEPAVTAELTRQLHALRSNGGDPALLDIGANLGWFSFAAAAAGHPAIAFEAMARNQAAAYTTMCLNPWMHDLITLYPFVLGSEAAQCHMWADPNNAYDGHLYCGDAGAELGMARCLEPSGITHMVRLDDYLPPAPRDLVMKIDVEGCESDVLRGAGAEGQGASVLASRVHFAMTELNQRDLKEQGTSVAEYMQLWTGMGFNASLASSQGFTPTSLETIEGAVKQDTWHVADVFLANSRWPRS